MKKPAPMTPKQFDNLVAIHEREQAVPWRLEAIVAWVAKIKADSNDIRNKPDVRQSKRTGQPYASNTTDLDALLAHVATVRRHFDAGAIDLARASLRDLDARIAAANARVTDPLIDIGQRYQKLGKQGRPTDHERNIEMARRYLARKSDSGLSPTALKQKIGAGYGLRRRAAINAIDSGLKALQK